MRCRLRTLLARLGRPIFRYKLRTLLIVMTIGPPLLAGALVAGKDSWPLFCAMGHVAYITFAIVFSVAVGRLLGQAIEGDKTLSNRD